MRYLFLLVDIYRKKYPQKFITDTPYISFILLILYITLIPFIPCKPCIPLTPKKALIYRWVGGRGWGGLGREYFWNRYPVGTEK